MEAMGIVYTGTAVTSAAGPVSIQRHTKCIHFINLHNSTNAVVRLNGGPHEIVIPANKNYVELEGDYTSFEVITAGVTVAVYAIG
jgi:spore coat polysaccharide biosynthesis protein SpsF (cytidylyltransferase family)